MIEAARRKITRRQDQLREALEGMFLWIVMIPVAAGWQKVDPQIRGFIVLVTAPIGTINSIRLHGTWRGAPGCPSHGPNSERCIHEHETYATRPTGREEAEPGQSFRDEEDIAPRNQGEISGRDNGEADCHNNKGRDERQRPRQVLAMARSKSSSEGV